MARLGKVAADLTRYRREWERQIAEATQNSGFGPANRGGRLVEVTEFGDNPGDLRMLAYIPSNLQARAPLVVALHGCTQTGEGYDHGSGWSALADRFGFALLVPEQSRANNQNLCFNWFLPTDTRRDRGEAKSIRDMVGHMIAEHGLDERRVFVTGLSAGGAMTSVMLAAYPEVFAGGAIIAGLPYGAASNLQQALEGMNGRKTRPAREWGYLVRRASQHKGPWPKVSIWHGGADATVQPSNAGEIIKQWTDLHGLPLYPTEARETDGRQHRTWRGLDGVTLVESHMIAGMGHGTPIAPGSAEDEGGATAPFILDAGVFSSYHIAKFWGLLEKQDHDSVAIRSGEPPRDTGASASLPTVSRLAPQPRAATVAPEDDAGRPGPISLDPKTVIEKALRAAGLMKR